MFQLRLFHDVLQPDVSVTPNRPVPHSILYAYRGSATVDDRQQREGDGLYVSDYAPIVSGSNGVTIWRWEVVERSSPLGLLEAEGVSSRLKMARDVKMFELVPTSKWLFRLDMIMGFQDTTGQHSHPGSGIRCMIHGHLRVESEKGETSDNREPGDAWYEEGAYPLVSTVDPGIKTTFLRGMVLPPEFFGYPDSAIWISGQPEGGVKNAGHKVIVDQVVTLR